MESDWSWSAFPWKGPLGVHGSFFTIIPIIIVFHFAAWSLIAWLLYLGYLILCRKRRLGPIEMLEALHVRLVAGNKWSPREID